MPDHGLDLVYRPDLPALIARWQREITPRELQVGYQAVLAAADEAQCSQWLLDLRRREDVIEPVVNAWFGTTFAPSLRGSGALGLSGVTAAGPAARNHRSFCRKHELSHCHLY